MNQYLDLAHFKHGNETLPLYLTPIKTNRNDFKSDSFYDEITSLATSEYGQTIYKLFKSDNDFELLINNAFKHGIYLEKFFYKDLSVNVKQKLFEKKIDLEIYYPLYCTKYNFGSYEKVKKFLPQNFALDFCKVSMYELNNLEIFLIVKNWFDQHNTIRTCEICKKHFRPAFFRDWVYFGAAGNITVCFECPIENNQNADKIIELVPILIKNCGFIPNADFSPINFNFSSKIHPDNWSKTVKTIFEIGNWRSHFDTWFKLLVKSNVLNGDILKTSRGIRCIAKSGNECNSLDELFIDNWLFENNFKVQKEPIYPRHEKYNASGKRRADWFVNGYYIEYFGLCGEEAYDKKVIEKMNLARELNLKLIALFPNSLNKIEQELWVLRQ